MFDERVLAPGLTLGRGWQTVLPVEMIRRPGVRTLAHLADEVPLYELAVNGCPYPVLKSVAVSRPPVDLRLGGPISPQRPRLLIS